MAGPADNVRIVPFWDALAILAAGFGAGAMNAVGGSGTLLTFPTLVALGYPPLLANVSNTVGLVPGSAAAVLALGPELHGQRARLQRFAVASATGALIGATLLLTLPESVFDAVVPALIALALVLVVLQPRLARAVGARAPGRPHGGALLLAALVGIGAYGGYFGAAQGILLIAVLGVLLSDDLHRLNATKNVLALVANFVAAAVFIALEDIDWAIAALIAGGSVVGGVLGARLARRLPPAALRAAILAIGTVAIVRLLA
ncbi:MAG: sulfite exporter TauE/SafE family protein [Sporichthyaceae bacterium]